MLALCLLVLCAASAVGRVIVDVTTQGPPIVYVAASEIAAGATLEVSSLGRFFRVSLDS